MRNLTHAAALLFVTTAAACATTEPDDGPTKDDLAASDEAGKSDGLDWCKARDYYGRFIDLWKNADPELQPLVRDVRQRLVRLTAEGAK